MEFDDERVSRSLIHGEAFAEALIHMKTDNERRKRKYDPVKRKEYYERTKKLKGRRGAKRRADIQVTDLERQNRNGPPTKVSGNKDWADNIKKSATKYTGKIKMKPITFEELKDVDWDDGKKEIRAELKNASNPEEKKLLETAVKLLDAAKKSYDKQDEKKTIDIMSKLFDTLVAYDNYDFYAAQRKAKKEAEARVKRGGSQIEDLRNKRKT